MNNRIPQLIQPLLQEYLALVEKELPDFMDAFYLQGSIALDAFNEHLSDIDFIAVLSRQPTPDDIQRLTEIHQTIGSKYTRWSLEGSYFQWDGLGHVDDRIARYPHYHDGLLHPAEARDVNSVTWCVTWWVLKNRGIGLKGPEPQELGFMVDWELLISKMKQNLNSYWAGFIQKPNRMVWLLTDYGVEWTALGVLRQYYSFKEHDITSKTGAGDYALMHVPERWNRLIREAINIRQQTNSSLYRSKFGRALDAYRFLRYIIQSCNNLS